jgi:hypothetical protein
MRDSHAMESKKRIYIHFMTCHATAASADLSGLVPDGLDGRGADFHIGRH